MAAHNTGPTNDDRREAPSGWISPKDAIAKMTAAATHNVTKAAPRTRSKQQITNVHANAAKPSNANAGAT